MRLTRLHVATGNAHKAEEIAGILGPLGITVLAAPDLPEVVEDGDTFAANAWKKALSAATHLQAPALADDSGLVVDVLGGAPGVHSARYAGRHGDDAANNARLVRELEDLGVRDPAAAFVCHVAIARPDGTCVARAEGRVEGVIRWPAAGQGGFGYDPHFHLPDRDRRMAELSAEEKHAISHRGRALRALVEQLRAAT